MFCKWANNWGLYIDVELIVGPGRTWYPPLPLFTSRPNSLIFLFYPPYIFFLVFFFYKVGVYNPDLAYTIKPKTLQILKPILNPIS
jgi:hypothetical protein